MKICDTSHFVCNKTEVENAGEAVVFGRGATRPSFDTASDNIFFVGIAGSGRHEVAEGVAAVLGMKFVDADDNWNVDGNKGVVAILPQSVLENAELRAKAHANGKIFYVMPDIPAMVQGKSDAERETLVQNFTSTEPLCMECLHFLLQPRTSDRLIQQVRESLNLSEVILRAEDEKECGDIIK